MKTNELHFLLFFLLSFLLFTNFSFAQGQPFCMDFNDKSNTTLVSTPCDGNYYSNVLDNWGGSNFLNSGGMNYQDTGSQGGTGDFFLHLDDGSCGSGGTMAFNSTDFTGNWIQMVPNENGCICFDLRAFHIQTGTITGFSSLRIYNGTDPGNSTLSAVFVLSTPINVADGWVRICAPIALSDGTSLPGNADGQWTNGALTPSDWDTLIQNVGSIGFGVDVASGDEKWGIDNICISDVCDATVGGNQPTDEGAFCCDESENLIQNGNFEFGNTGFNSQYTQSSSTLPGQYDVTNSAANFGATITDHSYCVDPTAYANNDQFMVVNGLTNQPSGSSSIIYSQNLPLEKEKEYKFCINFKNMPQCTFDIIPEVQIEINGQIVVPYTQINTDSTDPCDWMLLSGCFIGSGGKNQIRIRLKEDGLGDGNDLAIDDISVQEKIDPDYNLTVTHDGGNNTISATVSPFPFMNEACESDYNYAWFVYETTNPTSPLFGSVVSGTFAWSDSSGSYGAVSSGTPWATPTTNFPNYTTFQNNKFYVIGMYVPSCCESCYTDGWTYQITYNWSNRGVQQFEMTEEWKEEIKSLFVKTNIQSQEQPISDLIQIYPNPNQGIFNVKTENISSGKLEIYDMQGMPIYVENFNHKTEFQINLSNRSKGIYMMKLISADNRTFSENIIIK